jgi:uncharacterized protein with HEPN domain
MPENDRDRDLLELIVELISHVQRRVAPLKEADFMADPDEIDLTAFRLLHVGEASNKLSPALKARHPLIPWAAIYRMRNVISHDYFGVDNWLIWQTATGKLDDLLAMCKVELEHLPQ